MWVNISNRNCHVGRHVLFSNDHPCSTSNISITWVTSLASSLWHTCVAWQYMTSPFFWANSFDPNLPNKPYTYQNNKLATVSFTMKNIKAFTMIHSHNNNYSLLFHTIFFCFLHLLKFCGLKIIAEHFDQLNNLKLVDFNIHNFKCSYTMWKTLLNN